MTNTHFNMPKVQILVANAARARFFSVDSPTGELQELRDETNPEARMREEDLVTDRRGRYRDSGVEGRSALDLMTDPKEVAIQRFARELAQELDRERTQGEMDRLYLVASPAFLGELRKHLSTPLKALIVEEIAKDFDAMEKRHGTVAGGLARRIADRLYDVLVGATVHNMRGILTPIKANAATLENRLIRGEWDEQALRKYLRRILDGADRVDQVGCLRPHPLGNGECGTHRS
jgi:protein required for attachment to host cells